MSHASQNRKSSGPAVFQKITVTLFSPFAFLVVQTKKWSKT
ncbi:hypothetical protein [Enterobacter hormaechei]|nr:hypothetical protein CSC35_1836 [Enterobacter hormaechei]CDL35487.1 hypothetical protein [Enterobacter hormaechei]